MTANREAKIIQNKKKHLSSIENISEREKEKIQKILARKCQSNTSLKIIFVPSQASALSQKKSLRWS